MSIREVNIKDFKVGTLPTPKEILWDEMVDGSKIIAKGTKIKLKFVWGYYIDTKRDTQITTAEDLCIVLNDDTSAFECWVKLIEAYKKRMEEIEAYPRHYFFEGTTTEDDGTVVFIFGT